MLPTAVLTSSKVAPLLRAYMAIALDLALPLRKPQTSFSTLVAALGLATFALRGVFVALAVTLGAVLALTLALAAFFTDLPAAFTGALSSPLLLSEALGTDLAGRDSTTLSVAMRINSALLLASLKRKFGMSRPGSGSPISFSFLSRV